MSLRACVAHVVQHPFFFTGVTVVLWGLIPILDKLALARFTGHPMIGIAIRVGTVALMAIPAAWALSRGAPGRSGTLSGPISWSAFALFAASGIVSLLVSQYAYYRLLQRADVSRVFPFLFSAAPVVTMVLGVLLLHESLSLRQILGAALVIGGGLLLL